MRVSCLKTRWWFGQTRFEYDEDRWIGIGIMRTAVVALLAFTERDPDIVRIISLRKAMKHEKYEHTVRNRLAAGYEHD